MAVHTNTAGTITSFTPTSAAIKIDCIYAGDGYIEGITPEINGGWETYTGPIETPSKLADYKAVFFHCTDAYPNSAIIADGERILSIEQLIGVNTRITVASNPLFCINGADLDTNTINITTRRVTTGSTNKHFTYFQILGVR